MSNLSDRLRQGLVTAVISAAAIHTPVVAAEANPSKPPTTPATRSKPAASVKPAAPARKPSSSGGCGAYEGGCGPSR
jgi:hypothetical protein